MHTFTHALMHTFAHMPLHMHSLTHALTHFISPPSFSLSLFHSLMFGCGSGE
uniref:Uncharacterized protein n=1 Tax=Octopus bimaculoides TaxID=37653 RepID=A0A0L8GY14_OCTBM